jgi:hypothetical protein
LHTLFGGLEGINKKKEKEPNKTKEKRDEMER